jgi:hypothetical protein
MSDGQHVAYVYCACGHYGEIDDPELVHKIMYKGHRHFRCSRCRIAGIKEVRFSWRLSNGAFNNPPI